MSEHTHDRHLDLKSQDLRVRHVATQLRQENTDLRAHVHRLRDLLQDTAVFREEKHTTLETLTQSCVCEQTVKARLEEEERENECLGDLRYVLRSVRPQRLRLENIKRAVSRARCSLEDVQFAPSPTEMR